MGMYTELVIKCDLIDDLPDKVVEVLNFLFLEGDEPQNLPDHDFFSLENWSSIGRCSSYYHIPATLNFFDGEYLFSRSDLKNYEYEIDRFIDWISPYIDAEPGNCIGWEWYENCNEPTLILLGNLDDS